MGAGDIRVSVEQTGMRGIVGHDPHGHDCPAGNSQRAWNRIERCTGIEPASPAWKAGALTIVLTPRKGIHGRFTLFFFSGFLSGHLGPRTRTATHSGWRAAVYTNVLHGLLHNRITHVIIGYRRWPDMSKGYSKKHACSDHRSIPSPMVKRTVGDVDANILVPRTGLEPVTSEL